VKRLGAILTVLFAATLLLAACTDENDQFLQGTWYYKDLHLNQVAGETYLEVLWSFQNGTFEFFTCCFSGEIHQTGRYRILDSQGDVITLELFNVNGTISRGNSEVRIVIDRDADTLEIQGTGDFTRRVAFQR
jgi:hypothetical protein